LHFESPFVESFSYFSITCFKVSSFDNNFFNKNLAAYMFDSPSKYPATIKFPDFDIS
jgi:hypothetical protein